MYFTLNSCGTGTSHELTSGLATFIAIYEADFSNRPPPYNLSTQIARYTITTSTGCTITGQFEVEDCNGLTDFYFYPGVGDGTGSMSACTDDHTIGILANLRGDKGPFRVLIELIEAYGDVDVPWSMEYSFDELPGEDHQFTGLPSGVIRVSVADGCSGAEWRPIAEFPTCQDCEFIKADDGQSYFSSDGGLTIKQNCPCSAECDKFLIFGGSKRGLTVDINPSRFSGHEFPITITWPEPDEPTIIDIVNGEPQIVSGSQTIVLDEPGDVEVEIVRSDGCSSKLEFEFGDEEDEVFGFNSRYRLLGPASQWDAFNASYVCRACQNLNPSGYLVDPWECEAGGNFEKSYFNYTPSDPDFPCTGGGWIDVYQPSLDGTIQLISVEVPPSAYLDQIHTKPGNFFGIDVQAGETICREGITCLFKSEPIFGVDLGKDIMAGFCLWVQNLDEFNAWVDAVLSSGTTSDPDDCFLPCTASQTCLAGKGCYDLCPDGNCPAGYICTESGVCVPACNSNNDDCRDGLICHEGKCVDPCSIRTCDPDTEDCVDGECVDKCADCPDNCVGGDCVDPCISITCSDGEVCADGGCVEDICQFSITFPTSSDTYNGSFPHNLPIGTDLIVCFNTYTEHPDRITISGGASYLSGCVTTSSETCVTIKVKNDRPIRIKVVTNCDNMPYNGDTLWSLSITCGG